MSNTSPKPETDPLLVALRALPPLTPVIGDDPQAARLQREARAAYVRAFEDRSRYGTVFQTLTRAAVPVLLATVVGLYMTWAFATATALVR